MLTTIIADTDWDAVINSLQDQIMQLQQVITVQQMQITLGEQTMAQVQQGINQWGLPASSTAGISPCFVKKYQKTLNEKILYFTKINTGKHIIFSFQ